MDWMNGGLRPSFTASRPENSLSFLYNCNYSYDHYPGLEMKYPMAEAATPHAAAMMEKNIMSYAGMNEAEKKKRLTNEQLESLENSFMEDQKLEPERKMKLARELELQPRQIAVWFQNRRARWKAKELERSYDALKQDYDAVFTEKKRLQEEVVALKIMLRERASKNHQVSNGYTEISGEETVESTSMENPSSTKRPLGETSCHHHHQMVDQPNYVLNVDEYNPVTPMPAYWSSVMPSYH